MPAAHLITARPWSWTFNLTFNACPATAIHCMSTKFGVYSSSHFSFGVQTHTQMPLITLPTYRLLPAWVITWQSLIADFTPSCGAVLWRFTLNFKIHNPQNRKYITYCAVVKGDSSHSKGPYAKRKLGEVWLSPVRFLRYAHEETDKQTSWSLSFADLGMAMK